MPSNNFKILIIKALSPTQKDNRFGIIEKMCTRFIETCLQRKIDVDILDLYEDQDFNCVYFIDSHQETKTLEYQIRVKRADLLVFFHPIWWNSVPSILKGFLDKIFVPGFAYRNLNKSNVEKLLQGKKAIVFAVGELPKWQYQLLYNNSLKLFWQRVFADTCGVDLKVHIFGNFRKISPKEMDKWLSQSAYIASNINYDNSSLDWF